MMNENIRPATVGVRIGATLLDYVINFFTLGIGWFIWSLIVWKEGLTPGKQIFKLQVIDLDSQKHATWKQMFKRQVGYPILINGIWAIPILTFTAASATKSVNTLAAFAIVIIVIAALLIYFVDFAWFVSGDNRRLTDYWAKTRVVYK